MFFQDLMLSNKDWQDSTELIIISRTDTETAPLCAKAARSIFGDRQVLWFKDEVVMLL